VVDLQYGGMGGHMCISRVNIGGVGDLMATGYSIKSYISKALEFSYLRYLQSFTFYYLQFSISSLEYLYFEYNYLRILSF